MKTFPRAGRADDASLSLSDVSGSRLNRASFLGVLFGALAIMHAGCVVAADFVMKPASHEPDRQAGSASSGKSPENPEHPFRNADSDTEPAGAAQQEGSDSSPAAGAAACGHEIPVRESLLDKVIRILFRPDECGRNQGTDTSLSAGGAGGG